MLHSIEPTRIFWSTLFVRDRKSAALLVIKHAEGRRGTHGDERKAGEITRVKIINDETIGATREVLVIKIISSGQYPDSCIHELVRAHNLLIESE